jgi:hypothetical protein
LELDAARFARDEGRREHDDARLRALERTVATLAAETDHIAFDRLK